MLHICLIYCFISSFISGFYLFYFHFRLLIYNNLTIFLLLLICLLLFPPTVFKEIITGVMHQNEKGTNFNINVKFKVFFGYLKTLNL